MDPAQLTLTAPWTPGPLSLHLPCALRYLPRSYEKELSLLAQEAEGVALACGEASPSDCGHQDGSVNASISQFLVFPTGSGLFSSSVHCGLNPRKERHHANSHRHFNHPGPRFRDVYLYLPSRVTSASQELHGLHCATVGTTSPPWAQIPAFHVHQAPTAHILALRHPGHAQPMLTAKQVCRGASDPHPHRPYSPTICLSSLTHSNP